MHGIDLSGPCPLDFSFLFAVDRVVLACCKCATGWTNSTYWSTAMWWNPWPSGLDYPCSLFNNSRLSRDGEARPTPGRRGAPRPDGRNSTTNEQGDQPASGEVPTGMVGHSSETASGTTSGTTNETTSDTTTETNQRATEIESGSIVSAHKFGQSKPVSIGGC
jgi:hypothetical protein